MSESGAQRSLRRVTGVRRFVALAALLTVASMAFLASSTASASASTVSGGHTSTTWWFWEGATPINFSVTASASVWYDAYSSYGGWDEVTRDQDLVDVYRGADPSQLGTPILTATWLNYYQSGYNYVDSWTGQYWVPVSTYYLDSYTSVGDAPNYGYWDTMHVMQVFEGYPSSGCCGDQTEYFVK
ncbi:MAG: hypothetical protein ABSA40_08720 [Candidatus Dormibacteria bacterium]|jgi:hypothetical protein